MVEAKATAEAAFEELSANEENFALSQSDLSYYQKMFRLAYNAHVTIKLYATRDIFSEDGTNVFTQNQFTAFNTQFAEYFISKRLFLQPEIVKAFDVKRIRSQQVAELWSVYHAFSI